MVQAHVDRSGRGVLKEGASIIRSEKHFDYNVFAIDVTLDQDITISDLSIIKNDKELKASVIHSESLDIDNNRHRLFIRYENSVQDDAENIQVFAKNDLPG